MTVTVIIIIIAFVDFNLLIKVFCPVPPGLRRIFLFLIFFCGGSTLPSTVKAEWNLCPGCLLESTLSVQLPPSCALLFSWGNSVSLWTSANLHPTVVSPVLALIDSLLRVRWGFSPPSVVPESFTMFLKHLRATWSQSQFIWPWTATAALDVITAQKSVNFRFYCEAEEIYEPVSPGDRWGDMKLSWFRKFLWNVSGVHEGVEIRGCRRLVGQ